MVNRFRFPLVIFVMLFLVLLAFTVTAQDNSGRETITVENAASLVEIAALEGHEGVVNTVAFSSDSSILASGGDDTTVQLWDTATGENRSILEGNSPVNSIVIPQSEASGGVLFSAGQGVQFWDFITGEDIGSSGGIGGTTYAVAVSSDGSLLTMGEDSSVLLLNLNTFMFSIPTSHSANVRSLAFQPATTVLASGGEDGLINFTEIVAGTERPDTDTSQTIGSVEDEMDAVYSLAYHPDGTLLASGSTDDTVRIWDVTDYANVSLMISLSGHTDNITSVAFSPDGTMLVSASLDGTVRLWNVETQAEIAVLSGPDGTEFRSIAFSPDGTLIATAGSDGVVRLWGIGDDGAVVVEEIIPQEGEWGTESISFRPSTNVRLSFTVELDSDGNWEMVSNIISIQNTGNGVIAGTITFWDETLEVDSSFSGELSLDGRRITISGQFVSPTEAQGTININDGLPAVEWTANP